jgi:membrane-bound lytic murein transglycosylase D
MTGKHTNQLVLACLLSLVLSGCVFAPLQQNTATPRVGDTSGAEAVARKPHDSKGDGTQAAVARAPASNPVETDLWARIRSRMQFTATQQPRIDRELDWFSRNPEYIARVTKRARYYLYDIVEETERRDIPAEIALLPIVESAFQPFAYSHGRAAGLWKFIPATGKHYGLRQSWWYDGRRDVYAATRAALDYLDTLQQHFDGDWLLALAAYNTGEGNVHRAIKRNRRQGKPTDFWSLDLPRETRNYVPRLLAVAAIVRDPEALSLTLHGIDNAPYFSKVTVDGQIDLALAADLAGIRLEHLYELNPAFNRWATDPDGPHYLLLPQDKVETFTARLAELPAEKRLRWVRHEIQSGETIGGIAQKYHTSLALIRKVNQLKGNSIRAGRSLTIPVATRRLDRYALSEEQRRAARQNTPRKGRKLIYTTRSGDTLWDIARQHDVGVHSLAKWNGMAPQDTLRSGQRLVIWTQRPVNLSMADTSLQNGPPGQHIKRSIRYTVKHGDSLSRIASYFKVSVAQLRRWNPSARSTYLQPGQRLNLHIDVTRQTAY